MSISAYADRGFVTDFEINALSNNTGNIDQSSNRTLLGRSCGPMALLAVYNHYSVENTGNEAGFVANQAVIEAAVDRLYNYMRTATNDSVSHNGYPIDISYENGNQYPTTAIWELSYIAENRDNWNFTAQFEATRDSQSALDAVITHLQLDRPVIALTNGLYLVQHYVVVYEIDEENEIVRFFDPLDGDFVTASLTDFIAYWDSESGAYNYMSIY